MPFSRLTSVTDRLTLPPPSTPTECDKNPGYMLEACRVACHVCRPDGEAPKPPAPLPPEET
jgi:hypothetical protein